MAGGGAPGTTCMQTRPAPSLRDGSLCLQPSATPGVLLPNANRDR